MTKPLTYLAILALLATHVGAFYIGIRVAEPTESTRLSDEARAKLEAKVAEHEATIAHMVDNPREIIRNVPVEVARAATEIADAAGTEPSEGLGFSLAPVPNLSDSTFATSTPEGCDPCSPNEFSVSGAAQKFDQETWVLNATLYHKHGSELIWERALKGDVDAFTQDRPFRAKWFLGPTVRTAWSQEEEDRISYGLRGGITFKHTLLYTGIESDQTLTFGAAIRFGSW